MGPFPRGTVPSQARKPVTARSRMKPVLRPGGSHEGTVNPAADSKELKDLGGCTEEVLSVLVVVVVK